MSISAVINTKNAQGSLQATLNSLGFVDELVVADMQSTDKTLEIARVHGAVVLSVPDSNYVEPARNQAIAKATSDWVLLVDADETIPPDLAQKLIKLSKTAPEETAGFYLPRKNIIFGKWVEHSGWWPDYVLRFFRRGSVTWDEAIHSSPTVSGNTENLPAQEENAIVHQNYQSVAQFLDRMNRYTQIEALSRKKANTHPIAQFKDEFLRRFFAHFGWRDGDHGVALSFLQSFYEVVVVLKQWENGGFKSGVFKRPLQELTNLHRELGYWLTTQKIEESRGLRKLFLKIKRRVFYS